MLTNEPYCKVSSPRTHNPAEYFNSCTNQETSISEHTKSFF